MPARSPAQYGLMQRARSGGVPGIDPKVAEEYIHATPAALRKKFAKILALKRKRRLAGKGSHA